MFIFSQENAHAKEFMVNRYLTKELYLYGKSTRIPLEVCLFTKMPLEVPNLPNYPYLQKNTLYKVIIHSNRQALFTKIPLNLNLFTMMHFGK